MSRPVAPRPPPVVHAVRWLSPATRHQGKVFTVSVPEYGFTRCGRFSVNGRFAYTLTDAALVTCRVCRRAVKRWGIEPAQTTNSADGR